MSDVRVVVPIDVELASDIGIPDTFLLTQIDYWTMKVYAKEPDKYGNHFINNRWWVYNTVADWVKQFSSMFSKNTIVRALERLEKDGLVYTGVFNKMGRDRTKWYSVNYEVLFNKFPYTKQIFSGADLPITQNGEIEESPKMGSESLPKMGKALPKNTLPKSSTKNSNNNREFFRSENSAYLSPTEFANLLDDAYSEVAGTDVSQATRMQLADIAEYFAEHYTMNYGRNVPKISKQAALKAIKHLLYSEIEIQYGEHSDIEYWELSEHATNDVFGMIDGYFDTRFEADHSFCHFCSEGVIVRRWLEYRKNSFYHEDAEKLPFN